MAGTGAQAQISDQKAYMDSLRRDYMRGMQELRDDYDQYREQAIADYEKYEAQARADYEKYANKVKAVWGGKKMVDNTKDQWVEYSDDLQDRSIVDFKKGKVDVEVIVDEDARPEEIDRKLAEALDRVLESKGNTCPYESSVDKSKNIAKKPILEGLVDFSKYDLSKYSGKESSRNRDNQKIAEQILKRQHDERKRLELAEQILKQSKKEQERVVTPRQEGGKKKVTVELDLVANNLSKNAALYKDYVKEFSRKFEVEEPLIYAIMEQESSFNPKATSYVPAYGLMQLVPKTGGYDAYRYVYKKGWAPSKSYLYEPKNNIELGTAYLRVLLNQFKKVDDPNCRRICVIASYNTGAGNVSRAFIGSTRLGNAFPKINEYGYDDLFQYLTTRLSTQEARNYVKKVSERREKYL